MSAVKHYLLDEDFLSEKEMDYQKQANQELHERTVEVLTSLVDVLSVDDLSLLCFHCGIRTSELMPVELAAFDNQAE